MSIDQAGYQIFLGEKREPGESGVAEKGDDTAAHMQNFLAAVRSRRHEDLNGDVEEDVLSVNLVHMANISYRLGGRKVTSAFSDPEASAMRTHPQYREPYVFPKI